MSFHVLTINTAGAYIHVSRGFVVCKYKDLSEKKIPISDLKILVLATPQISFSNQCLARLLENDITVLHCCENYQPIGWTIGLDKVVRREAFLNQVSQNKEFESALWSKICFQKIHNQLDLLNDLGIILEVQLSENPNIEEARIARLYWDRFFNSLTRSISREKRNAESFENKALNYGYAVIKTMIYRGILIHGLLPSLGIQHKAKFHGHALVYDLIEPWRPFIDMLFAHFAIAQAETIENYIEHEILDSSEELFKEWIQFFMNGLADYKLPEKNFKYKLIDFMDIYILSIMKSFEDFNLNELRLPILNDCIKQGK